MGHNTSECCILRNKTNNNKYWAEIVLVGKNFSSQNFFVDSQHALKNGGKQIRIKTNKYLFKYIFFVKSMPRKKLDKLHI